MRPPVTGYVYLGLVTSVPEVSERVALFVPRLPDTVWSIDFMGDALACGRRFRTFNVVDDFDREALHIEVDTSITSTRLVPIFE